MASERIECSRENHSLTLNNNNCNGNCNYILILLVLLRSTTCVTSKKKVPTIIHMTNNTPKQPEHHSKSTQNAKPRLANTSTDILSILKTTSPNQKRRSNPAANSLRLLPPLPSWRRNLPLYLPWTEEPAIGVALIVIMGPSVTT